MDIGMLWFDNDPKLDLQGKVAKAAAYYHQKYGEEPTLCFVHPSMLAEPKVKAGAVAVCSNSTVQPNHFWIGVQQNNNPSP